MGMQSTVQIGSWSEADVPPGLRSQVLTLHERAWPGHKANEPPHGHDRALRPLSMLLIDDRRVLCALDILSKEVTHHGRRYAASGLSAVVTDEAIRRKGYGRQLVAAAREVIAASGADLGVFTCDPPLQTFCQRAGWQILVGTVLVGGTPEAPFPSDRLGKVTIGSFFSERARRAAESFTECRIELYPGNIDKLW